MAKALVINRDHPKGYITEIADEFCEDVVTEPTPEERLEALEKAMLDMIKGGVGNA